MNSSFALEPISQDNLLVTIALVLVGLVAIVTIIGMIVGARMKQRRDAARREEEARIADLKADGVEATNTVEGAPLAAPTPSPEPAPPATPTAAPSASAPAPVAAPPPAPAPPSVAPAPVAPPLPPLADQPAPGTPPLADEPIAAAAPLDASPASVAADVPTAAPEGSGQPVTILKGLGPKIATRLAELGITDVDHLAWLDDAEADALDAQLGPFQGRMTRDRWREQARLLAQGDRAGYEAQFGKLG